MKLINRTISIVVLYLSIIFNLSAKEVKPQLLVYGDNIQAFAAALQSARSGVPTLWVMPSGDCCSELLGDTSNIANDNRLIGGIWMNLLQEVGSNKEKKDSLFTLIQQGLRPQMLKDAILNIIANQENLTVRKNFKVTKLTNNRKNIDVVWNDKSKTKVLAVVDATYTMDLKLFLKEQPSPVQHEVDTVYNGPIVLMRDNILRTIVATGISNQQICGISLRAILAKGVDNIFFTADMMDDKSINSLPFQLVVGQAVGACAAYTSFFKTTADKVDVRKVQTELMSFDSRLIPFADISVEDPNFNALQRIFLVNILPWDHTVFPLQFNGTDSVSIASVRPVIQQLYSRAQLWFLDNETQFFKTKDLIELIKVVAFRGDELDEEIEKAWTKRFKLSGTFSPSRTLSRYEFAVLMDAYAESFAKRVNLQGVILR